MMERDVRGIVGWTAGVVGAIKRSYASVFSLWENWVVVSR